MCGIVYYHSSKVLSVVKPILKRFQDQRSRGTEGFGIVGLRLDDKKLTHYNRFAEEQEIKDFLESIKKEATNAILFHHRHPTSTPNFAECAHPILVNNDQLDHMYFGVHNGIIYNDHSLKPDHERDGFVYNTACTKSETWEVYGGTTYSYPKETKYNDSEALIIELARVIDGKKDRMEARGSIAFIVLQATREGVAKKLFFGRNSQNPLYIENKPDHFCLRSQAGKDAEAVKVDTLYCYDYETGLITEKEMLIGSSVSSYGARSTDTAGWLGAPRTTTGFRTGDDDEYSREYENYHRNRSLLEDPAVDPEDMGYDDSNVSFPALTFEEYSEGVSVLDSNINDWLAEGNTIDEQQTQALEEYYLVEMLLEFEQSFSDVAKDEHRIDWLEKRLTLLGDRCDDLDNRADETRRVIETLKETSEEASSRIRQLTPDEKRELGIRNF